MKMKREIFVFVKNVKNGKRQVTEYHRLLWYKQEQTNRVPSTMI